MSERTSNQSGLPRAKVERRRWRLSVVWIVPVVAALVAGYLIYQRVREYGPAITIRFKDAAGLRPGQTPMQYRGVIIGEVSSVELSKDREYAIVKLRLKRFASSMARKGSRFWIVRPELNRGTLTGLGTIITGPHIEVLPGDGPKAKEFFGAESSPVTLEPHGLKVVLLANHSSSLRAGAPVYYRGIDVGAVQESRLSTNATRVEIHAVIKQRYAPLVRTKTKFWNVTGLDFKFSLFRGAEVNVESLKSLIVGGVAFATPEDPKDQPVEDGMMFRLYEQPEKDWLEWSPQIAIAPGESEESLEKTTPATVPATGVSLPSAGSP